MIKTDFTNAIRSLYVSEKEAYGLDSSDMLDFAMLIALHCQELNLIRRIKHVEGTHLDRPLSPIEEKEIANPSYDWKHFEGTPDGKKNEINKILSRMDEIQAVQEYNESWYSQKYADKKRKGLPVVAYGHLMQYSNYLKGVYFHSVVKYKEALHFYTESLKQGCDKTRITKETNKLV